MDFAVIGGSGRYELGVTADGQAENAIETPYGDPSSPVSVLQFGRVEVGFLARHGLQHQHPPHRVNYRANIWALKSLGCNAIVALNAVGAVNPTWSPGTLVIPDQIIDYTWGRESSFEDASSLDALHIDFSHPYDKTWTQTLLAAGDELGLELVDGGVHGVTQGPRLETTAEVRRLANDGCDLIGMTGMPEAALAREAGIPYVCLAVVVNPAAGVTEDVITMDEVKACLAETEVQTQSLLGQVIRSRQ